MARKKNKSEVKISADLSQLNQAMRDAARSIQIANAEFKKATAGLDKWSDSAQGVQAKITQLNKTLDAENKKLSVLNEKYRVTVANQGKGAEQAKKLAVEIAKQQAKIAKTEADIKKYNEQLDSLVNTSDDAEQENKQLANSFDDVAKKSSDAKTGLEKFGSYLEKGVTGAAKVAGKAILAIGTAAVGAGAASVKAGMSFDEQMSTVKAISGATEEEFEQLRKKALEMGSTTKFTATESGKALEYMGMAGWKAQDMIEGLPGIINAAAASGEDLGTVSDIITDGLTAFGLQAEDSSHFADVLAAASANANTNITLMGDTFKYVAPVAGALKYSIDDVAMGVGLMANAGIKADQAGTSLRSMLSRMAAPTKNVAAAMEELGISMSDDEGNMKSFDELVNQLRESFSKLTEQEKAKYANDIAGKTAMSGMLAIVNSSTEDYNKLTEAIRNADGAAKEMADTRLDNLQGDVTIFRSALEGAAISISDQMAPALREFVQEGTAMIPELSGDIADLGGELAGVATGLMPIIKDAVKALVPIAKEIMEVIKDILPYLSEIFQSMLPVAEKLIEAIVRTVKPLVENILPPLTRLVEQLAKVLEPILDILTPILEVLSEIVGAITGGVIDTAAALISAFTGGSTAAEKAYKQFSQLSSEEQKLADNAKKAKDEQDGLNESLKNGFKDVDKEQGTYDRLVERLKAITDEDGKVKKGKEELAKSIIEELNDAYGLEIQMADGVIQKYQEQMDKLDELRQKKKAQAYLDSAEDEYSTALQNRGQLQQDYAEALNKYDKQRDVVKDLETQKAMERNEVVSRGGIFDDREWNAKIDGAKEKLSELRSAWVQTSLALSNNEGIITNFEELSDAIAENDMPKIEEAMENMKNGFIDAETGTEEALGNQVMKFANAYAEMYQASKVEGSKITEEQVRNAHDMYLKSLIEYQKLTGDTGNELVNMISMILGKKADFESAGAGLGQGLAWGMRQQIEEARTGLVSAVQDIVDGIASIDITSGISINSPSDIVYYAKKGKKTATGGIVTRPQTRIVGEDGAEAIVPLEKNTGWIDAVAQKVVLSMGGAGAHMQNVTNNYNFNQTNNSPKALSRLEIYRQSKNLLSFKKA